MSAVKGARLPLYCQELTIKPVTESAVKLAKGLVVVVVVLKVVELVVVAGGRGGCC